MSEIIFILCKNEDGFHGECDYLLRYVILDGKFHDEPQSALTKQILRDNPDATWTETNCENSSPHWTTVLLEISLLIGEGWSAHFRRYSVLPRLEKGNKRTLNHKPVEAKSSMRYGLHHCLAGVQ